LEEDATDLRGHGSPLTLPRLVRRWRARAWEIALKFKDPNYLHNPAELGKPPAGLDATPSQLNISNSTSVVSGTG